MKRSVGQVGLLAAIALGAGALWGRFWLDIAMLVTTTFGGAALWYSLWGGVKRSRWNWLLLPIAFGVTFRIILWFYWMPARNAWRLSHGGGASSVAYGEGEIDAWAVAAAASPWIFSLICCAVGSAPRLAGVLLLGLGVAIGAMTIGVLTREWAVVHSGAFVATHGPVAIATVLVTGGYYLQSFRARHNGRAA